MIVMKKATVLTVLEHHSETTDWRIMLTRE